jgi:tRNA dimethylallyltransferase
LEKSEINKKFDGLLATKTVPVITGPTASGKTGLSLGLAEIIPVEIISADSRQTYKYMDICTAKPTQSELKKAKHHFIDILTPDEDYNAGQFGDEAEKTVAEIFARGKLPVVVGGSGLYVQSLCEGLFTQDENMALKGIRSFLSEQLRDKGRDYLYNELQKVDKAAAEKYSDRNPRRVLRAMEYYYTYGESILNSREKNKTKRSFNYKYFGINFEREKLYERINLRTDMMWRNGLLDETVKLLRMGYSPELNSLNTVGYKETIAYINRKISEEKAIDEIKKNTRRYAKRQMTWFRKISKMHWFDVKNYEGGEIPAIEILKNI